MNYIKIILCVFLVQHIVHSTEQETSIDSSNHRWDFESVFNPTTVALAKNFIKEVYRVPKPSLPVVVQTDLGLCKEEKRFLYNRMPIIQQNLQKYFNVEQPVRIGFCCSGGGNRAMIGTLGLLTGAAKSHILDSILYLAGLSGSTWLISQFCYLATTHYRKKSFELILNDIKNTYKEKLHDYSMLSINGVYAPPLISFDSTDDVCLEIAKRFAFEQPLTLVNLFGALVGDYALGLMGHDRLSEKWSRIIPNIQKGEVPFPLCSAAFQKEKSKYGWFEMSPVQCGSKDLGYVPTMYLGSYFSDGLLQTDFMCPEYPVSFYLGMYGSAFAATIQDIASIQKSLHEHITLLKKSEKIGGFSNQSRNFLDNPLIQSFVQDIIQNLMYSRNVLTYAQFPNFSYNINTSILKNEQNLGLFDAGIAFDLPLPLLIDRPERNLDIIFLYCSFPGQKKSLQALEKYCYEQGTFFPDLSMIDDESLQSQEMVVFNHPNDFDYNKAFPTYIYFATNDIDIQSAPYMTLNFRYTQTDIETLTDKTEQMFLHNIDEIKNILQLVADKKYRKKI